jgi:hypothetical protein
VTAHSQRASSPAQRNLLDSMWMLLQHGRDSSIISIFEHLQVLSLCAFACPVFSHTLLGSGNHHALFHRS